MNFNPEIEYQPREVIKAFQEERLRTAIDYLAAHSPYYHRMFAEQGIDPKSIQTLEDLTRLPFTEKRDLQLYNDDFLCCPKEKIVD